MCKTICIESTAALTGKKKGFKTRGISPNIFTHCMIHREALAVKNLQPFFNKVLQDAIYVINSIK